MKQDLFLLALISIVLPFCKAGPLRLQKRAVFYIANETACVVDNIVYSNGEPIPTDDPCEACRCRPPGFACVLKECRVKPGCRAVRKLGQCCPDYVCGCEHNGRMYQDGEEIRDEKNPCYICHCQGSSIACAFVDCFFRIGCVAEYVSGECCPHYTNCTADLPDRNSFENNNVPSLNLLPDLNDDSIFSANLPTSREPDSFEIPTDPPVQPSVIDDKSDETVPPEVKESTTEVIEPQTTEYSDPEASKLDHVLEEKNAEEETALTESNNSELPKDESGVNIEEHVEKKVEEIIEKVLFNSETEIKNDENTETTTIKFIVPTEPSGEGIKDDPQTTIANDEEHINEAAVTEKSLDTESTSTETLSNEKEVKNSAADNSKSLKLSDDEDDPQELPNVTDNKKELEETQSSESTSDETVAQSSTELTKTESADPTASTESKQESEITPEESQNKPQILQILYSSGDKIKSQPSETISIVVHVKEKPKLTTETDFVAEEVTADSVTSVKPENLEKFNTELNTEISTGAAESGKEASTISNFELFPTSTESDPSSSLSEESSDEGVEGRSEEMEVSTSKPEENSSNSESDLKNQEESSVATTQKQMDVTETPTEVKTDEDTKTEEPSITVIKIDEPNMAIKIKVTTNPGTQTPENKEPTENESESVETTEKTKSEKSLGETKSEESVEETKSEKSAEETKSQESAEETKSQESAEEPESHKSAQETKPKESVEETKSKESIEETKSEESVTETKSEESVAETKSDESVQEIKPEKSIEETELEKDVEETKPEKIVEESKPEVRDDDSTLEEQTTSAENTKITTERIMIINSTSPPTTTKENEPEERAAESETTENDNKTNAESTTKKSQKIESAVTTESTNKYSEESVQTEAANNDN